MVSKAGGSVIQSIKKVVKATPIVGPALMHLRKMRFSSSKYWDSRYSQGGTSGSGSYNRLAEFKAEFLNGFVEQNGIASVIEFGCGDGSQLKLARYPSYIGVDISPKAVEICRSKFAADPSKTFCVPAALDRNTKVDLSLSLDVVYHLVEDPVFDAYMRRLFACARRFAIVYSSNWNHQETLHVRHREFTKWVDENEPGWRLLSTVKNRYPYDAANPDQTSLADFYVFAPRA
ncbi:MAG: class I SAM-dependent methyltransferase [Acidobacteriota bacterium]